MMLPRNFEEIRAQQKRAEQNRANAEHSTGPVTPAGKQAVSYNAARHNLTSTGKDRATIPGEEPAFAQFCANLLAELDPQGAIEQSMAEDLCADRWRLRRAKAMERALFDQIERENGAAPNTPLVQAQAWIDSSKGLQRLALYAARIQRAIDKNTAALEARQSARKAAAAKAREEAILLTQLAEFEGKPYDPGTDFLPASAYGGFVYSATEITAAIARAKRLEDAKTLFAPEIAQAANAA